MKKVIIPILLVTAGALLSLVVTTTVRFVTLKEPETTHYHADFMIHINGKMMMLDNPAYYEEEAPVPCTSEGHSDNPLERATCMIKYHQLYMWKMKLLLGGISFKISDTL